MASPARCWACAGVVLLLLAVLSHSADAARGNTLQNHVLSDKLHQHHSAREDVPAWQAVDAAASMDDNMRTLAEYALNAADDDGQAAEAALPSIPSAAEEDTPESRRRLLEEWAASTAEDEADASPSAQAGNILPASAWQDEGATMEASRKLLEEKVMDAAAQAIAPALQEVVSTLEASRRLLQASVTNTTLLKEEAKAVLLASDAFGMVYTGGNFARAIFALLTPMVVAGQTGAVAVDANYLLNLSQLLAQFVATLGDLLSKGARLNADGIAPV
jgi:hypothetical protein